MEKPGWKIKMEGFDELFINEDRVSPGGARCENDAIQEYKRKLKILENGEGKSIEVVRQDFIDNVRPD